jgi:predicted lipoprotein with Yx(FWY)xxD motif
MARLHRRAPATLIAAALAASVVAVACGGGTSDADKTKTAAAGTGATPAASATRAAASPTTAPGGSPTAGATRSPAATDGIITIRETAIGKVLADDRGFTLYTFANDVANSGKSVVTGQLAAAWPPVLTTSTTPPTVSGASGTFTIITRDDGTKQVAYNGKPLYRFANDAAPGDTKGDKLGNVWFVATP